MKNWNDIFKFKLNKINKVFDVKKVLNSPTDPEAVARYYKINILAYSLIYREKDFIHMALTPPRKKV